MPCVTCNHSLADHPYGGPRDVDRMDDYVPCSKCECKRYVPDMFECDICGDNLTETEARRGDDFCPTHAAEQGSRTWRGAKDE